jgi:5,10-methylenetetrahydromethanopterin reductase
MRESLMLTDISGSDAIYCSSQAEERDLETVWIPEMTRRDSISILGAISAKTSRIRIAPGILNVYSRTPALIAMTLLTLQELSGGRLVAGLSSGNPDYIREIHGMKFVNNIQRLRETIAIVREALSSENMSYSGKIFTIKRWAPKFPKMRPFPIYVGAHNPKLLEFVGEACDGVILNLVSPENVTTARRIIQNSETKHGRKNGSVDISSILMIAVDVDPSAAEKRVRKQVAFYLARSSQIRKRLLNSKFAEEISKTEKALINGRQDDIASELSREFVNEIAVYGNKREVEMRLLEYEKAGLDQAIFYVAGWMGDPRQFTDRLLGFT